MRMLRALLGFFLLYPCFGTMTLADHGERNMLRAPISMRDQFPAALIHSLGELQSPQTIPTGDIELQTDFTWSNTFAWKRDHYLFDGETRVAQFEINRGFSPTLELGIAAGIVWRGGGVLDDVIENWHDFFNLPQGNRTHFAQDQILFESLGSNGADFDYQESGIEFSNTLLKAKQKLSQNGSAWQYAVAGELTLPTGTDFQQEGLNVGIGAFAERDYDWGTVSRGAWAVYLGDQSFAGIEYVHVSPQLFAQAAFLCTDSLALHLGVYGRGPLLKNLTGFPDYVMYLDTGVSYRISDQTRIEFLVRENPVGSKGTPDISGLVGVRVAL